MAPGDDSLRPLKPQLDLAQPAPPPYVPATFVLMLAGLTAFGYWLIRRTIAVQPEPLRPVPVPAPPPTAADIAREQLDAVAASGLAQSDPAEYYTRIAAITRSYLSERFGFAAYAMTRREMEREMRRTGIDRWPARVTANLLEQCDAVEFALFEPATERRAHDLSAAYEIVDLTRARPRKNHATQRRRHERGFPARAPQSSNCVASNRELLPNGVHHALTYRHCRPAICSDGCSSAPPNVASP